MVECDEILSDRKMLFLHFRQALDSGAAEAPLLKTLLAMEMLMRNLRSCDVHRTRTHVFSNGDGDGGGGAGG